MAARSATRLREAIAVLTRDGDVRVMAVYISLRWCTGNPLEAANTQHRPGSGFDTQRSVDKIAIATNCADE